MKVKILFTLALFSGAACAQSVQHTAFGMIGIGPGQVLRLTLIDGSSDPTHPPEPCSATLGFLDSNGNKSGATRTVNLNPGQTASLLKGGGMGNAEFQPVVTPLPGTPPDSCQAIAEIYEKSSGNTVAAVRAVNPQPLPPGQTVLIGVGFQQTLRLNVVAHPPEPCAGTLSFADGNGKPIGPTLHVDLNNNRAAHLDINGLVTAPGQRKEVAPVFTAEATAIGFCFATIEIDSFSGTTAFADNWNPFN